ncbi:MAG TPA: protein phosphatase 2C domain-containing protein [Pyrinomonadaceae bacterium]|nr:protein phosphatase 2C domain-containing protein [Pyrinomonadaceae bacterium]
MNDHDAAAAPLPKNTEVKRLSSLVQAEFGALSHQGSVRSENEDRYLVLKLGRDQQTLITNVTESGLPLSFQEWGYLFSVADGTSDEHAQGGTASSLALGTAVQLLLRFGRWNLRIDDRVAKEVMERTRLFYERLSDVVSEQTKGDPLMRTGTTLTTAFSAGNELFVAHVGDSRAYLWRNGKLHRLTHDQTYAQLLADAGKISQEEVDTHHLRHVLTDALGLSEGKINVQVKRLQLEDADCVLLCTNGLTNMVSEDQIAAILQQSLAAQETCAQLVSAALENGGTDNVTSLVGKYSIPT